MPQDRQVVSDEIEFLRQLVPLRGARVIDLGCGKADFSRRLLGHGLAASVAALEVDERLHLSNVASAHPERLNFALAGAEDIPFADASFDVAVMLKSLHHVPIELLDRAFGEIRRVLVPGGYLYVSEPVCAGDFNDLVRLFHDEGLARAAAYDAIRRAAETGFFEQCVERTFDTALTFRDFDDFVERIVKTALSGRPLPAPLEAEVRKKFESFTASGGATFKREMRVNLLRRPE